MSFARPTSNAVLIQGVYVDNTAIGAGQKGKVLTQEHIDKIVASRLASGGYTVSQNTKDKLSKAHKGRVFSGLHLANLRTAIVLRDKNKLKLITV